MLYFIRAFPVTLQKREVCAQLFDDIDQGIYKVKLKVALTEKRNKLHGFSFSINITNFEAFCRTKKLISNLFFLKSVDLLDSLD